MMPVNEVINYEWFSTKYKSQNVLKTMPFNLTFINYMRLNYNSYSVMNADFLIYQTDYSKSWIMRNPHEAKSHLLELIRVRPSYMLYVFFYLGYREANLVRP